MCYPLGGKRSSFEYNFSPDERFCCLVIYSREETKVLCPWPWRREASVTVTLLRLHTAPGGEALTSGLLKRLGALHRLSLVCLFMPRVWFQ